MIRVDRWAVREPDVLRRGGGSPADREFDRAHRYYSDYDTHRQQGGFQFEAYRHKSVKSALRQLFHEKCAYCETPLAAAPGDVAHFRPKAGVLAADGSHLPLHYWWLANEWTNLYLACNYCNRVFSVDNGRGPERSGKGGRFPLIDEAKRATPLATGAELDDERPLLLDPCVDDVEKLLLFSEDGRVSSSDVRGQTTIEIFGLNRESLVVQRQMLARNIENLIKMLAFLAVDDDRDSDSVKLSETVRADLQRMSQPDAPYASLARQLINAGLTKVMSRPISRNVKEELKTPDSPTPTRRRLRQTKSDLQQFQAAQESYSLELADNSFDAYVQRRDLRVERIVVRNMRGIGRIEIGLAADAGRGPWLMLLGENASGKSTILHAIALALVGEKYRKHLLERTQLKLTDLIRTGSDFAEIRIRLSGATEDRRLIFYRDGRIETKGREAQLMLLGYGSTRLLPRGNIGEETSSDGAYARLENLFNPFVPLIDAEQWLLEADDAAFDYASVAIKGVLNIPLAHRLKRSADGVGLVEHGVFTPLARLCDGYQTVIALVVDILSLVLRAWKTAELAQGLVLIDEVGNHLHPSWKLRFVESFREILPGMQVIATTHEPLCLRGLGKGEVALVRRGVYGGVQLVDDLPSIEGLRIDQILMSEHFGLQSTLDPALQTLFDRYHKLLRRAKPSDADRVEIEALRNQINEVQIVGHSERERRMLAAIDRLLANPAAPGDQDARDEQEAALDAELEAIWNNTPQQTAGEA